MINISVPSPKNAIELHPAANPSSPSVKFTALLKPTNVIKQIGNIISEVLVLGLPDQQNEPVLVSPLKRLQNGIRLY